MTDEIKCEDVVVDVEAMTDEQRAEHEAKLKEKAAVEVEGE